MSTTRLGSLTRWTALAGLLALCISIISLDAVPLRGDEAFNIVNWTRDPFSTQWWAIVQREPHPVGGFLLFIGWIGLVGDTVFAARMLAVLSHVLGTAVCIALAQRFVRAQPELRRVPIMAGLLWAVHPLLVWHAQDARHYSTYIALSALGWLTLLRALDTGGRRDWGLAILVQAGAAYLFFFEIFVILARAIYSLLRVRRSRRSLARFLAASVLLSVLLIPFGIQLWGLLTAEGSYRGNAGGSSIASLTQWIVPSLVLGDTVLPSWIGLVLATAVVVGVSVFRMRIALSLWLVMPLTLVYLVSLRADYFSPRYLVAVVPAIVLALAALTDHLSRVFHRSPALMSAIMTVPLLLYGLQLYNYFAVLPPKAPDWPGLVAYLDARTSDGDVIVSDSFDPALEYYYKGPAEIAFIGPQDQARLNEVLAGHDVYWLMRGATTDLIENQLRAQAQYITDEHWPGIIQYRTWDVTEDEIEIPLSIRFGDVAILRGYTRSGGSVVMLYWQPISTTDRDFSILTRLLSKTGDVTLLDHGVAYSTISTRVWVSGALYRDPITLPRDLPDADYDLVVGIYPTGTTDFVSADCDHPTESGCDVGTLFLRK